MNSFSLPEKTALRLRHWIMSNGLVNFGDIQVKLFFFLSNTCLRNLLIHVHSFSLNRRYFSQNYRLSSVMNTK